MEKILRFYLFTLGAVVTLIGLSLLVYTHSFNTAKCERIKEAYEKGDPVALERVGPTGGYYRGLCDSVGVQIGDY